MKSKAKRTLMQMGFSISNNGFTYIVDALEMIRKEPDIKFVAVYETISRKNKKAVRTVERAINWEIQNYYATCKVHPLLNATNTKTGQFPTKEFLMRLYLIVCNSNQKEGDE